MKPSTYFTLKVYSLLSQEHFLQYKQQQKHNKKKKKLNNIGFQQL